MSDADTKIQMSEIILSNVHSRKLISSHSFKHVNKYVRPDHKMKIINICMNNMHIFFYKCYFLTFQHYSYIQMKHSYDDKHCTLADSK